MSRVEIPITEETPSAEPVIMQVVSAWQSIGETGYTMDNQVKLEKALQLLECTFDRNQQ